MHWHQHPACLLNDVLTTTLPLLCQNQHVKVQTKYTKSEESVNMLTEGATTFEAGLKVKNDSPLPKVVAAPLGAGVETDPNYAPIDNAYKINLPIKSKSNDKLARLVQAGHALEDSLHITFSYETSPMPERAGPAADAFLVPAMWFEVVKVWKVSYAGAPHCKILGEMDVTLKANAELTGFSFTTANDIETRTLPLLTEQAAEIGFKRTCQQGGSCCRVDPTYGIDDDSMGCTATTLLQYCIWKDPGGVAACLTDHDSDTASHILEAVRNWNGALGRNYKNHERARNMKGSNAAVQYADGSDVSLAPLTGLAPTILIDNALPNDQEIRFTYYDVDGNVVDDPALADLRDEMKTWNMLEIAGGGSKLVFETNRFTTAPDAQGNQRIIKDSSSSYQEDVDCNDVWEDVEMGLGIAANVLSVVPNAFAAAFSNAETAAKVVEYAGYIEKALKIAKAITTAARPDIIDAACGRTDKTSEIGLSSESDTGGVTLGVKHNVKSKSTLMFQIVTKSEAILRTTEDDTSQARFTLQDGDPGDYFVLSVWSDPDFGTPLFSLDGGASQCLWEVGTAHRSMPMLKAEYIGPEQIGPDDAALFRVNVGNGLSYYEAGISPTKYRPGWSIEDGGYRAQDMDLAVVKKSLAAGLTVKGGLGTYTNVGKGSFDILLKVHRGFLAYEYSPPALTWTALCSHQQGEFIQLGEASAPVSLSMPNPEQVVRFTVPCPEIVWSGKILADQQFAVLATGAQSVPVAVHVKPPALGVSGTRDITRLGLQYRTVTGVNKRSPWQGMDTSAIASGTWTPALLDGEYEIRAVAECTEEFSSKAYDTSTTSLVRGVFDRFAPELVSLTTSSHSNALSPGDFITLQFSEDVVCRPLVLEITVAFGASSSYSLKSSQLKRTCTGSAVTVALLDFTSDSAAEVAGEQITVSVSGLYDKGGNVGVVAARPLDNGQAGLERQAIDRKADGIKDQLTDFNATLQGTLTAQFHAVRKNITDHVDENDKKLDEKLKAILKIVSGIQNSSVGGAGRFPDCDTDMASFGRYITGTVSSEFSEKAADVPKPFDCAKLCLDNDDCVAFGFNQGNFACMLGVADESIAIGSVYTYSRGFRFYNRLASCPE